ncbi:LysE family translocator [Curvibacter sp. APW13]|uniref:LysE family translocator n=1 Tax=Curvibacter sp. APW13 TaxID=3077236 RepID=UPI0028DF2E0E|nr:LysE family translocator [Curvibacter sp. APW13]MDT8989363.1 LysE family translocator [Curvibacter sp. APW13]
MTLSTLWLFVVMTFFVSATPGPNMLLIMSIAARSGLRVAVAGMAGCMTALMLMMGISAAGLGALLQAFPTVFEALRLMGAAYLAYLGVQVWRSPVSDSAAAQQAPLATAVSTAAIYRQGFLVAASNPKAILFAAAFFPQFINLDAAKLPQFAILLTTFAVIEISWYFIYAASGKRLSAYLQRPTILRAFNRATGGVFVGFAALMAFAKE